MTAFNPFDANTTVTSAATRPRVRVAEVNETNTVLVVELVDEQGVAVLQLQRLCLRPGDSFTIKDVDIKLQVSVKEK